LSRDPCPVFKGPILFFIYNFLKLSQYPPRRTFKPPFTGDNEVFHLVAAGSKLTVAEDCSSAFVRFMNNEAPKYFEIIQKGSLSTERIAGSPSVCHQCCQAGLILRVRLENHE